VGGIPLRFVSLVAVAYLSVAVLALAFGAPATFVAGATTAETASVTFRAVSVGAVFSVVGAATADSLF
jgi:uncharacterized membrane protein